LRDAVAISPGASCLEHTQLVDVIADALRTEDVDSRVEVVVEGDPDDPFVVEYTVRRSGSVIAVRRFDAEATNCEQLHAVVGVSVALAIDATLLLPEPIPVPPPPKPEPAPKPEPEPKPDKPASDPERPPELSARDPRPAALEPSPWRAAAVMRAGLGVQAPPSWAGVGAAAVELRWRERVFIDAGIVGAQAGFVDLGEGRAAFALVGGMLELCGGASLKRVRPRGCVGIVGGGALARGRGFSVSRNDQLPWLAATFGGDLRVPVTRRVELEFGADGVLNLLRPGFDFVDETGDRRIGQDFPWFGGWLTAGVVVAFR
jgi:hypothetical protein